MSSHLPLVELKNVEVGFNQYSIIQNVSLRIEPKEILTLIGPNGAGKSTLVKVILNLIKPNAGQVLYPKPIKIGYMPQRLSLDPSLPLTVKRFLTLSGCKDTQEIHRALSLVNALSLMDHPLHKVSGGELQRVLLARAILRKPELLVLDEPTQGVDITGQAELYQLITQIRDQLNCGVLLVSHDLHLVMATTDRVICLNQHICCSGHPDAVSQHPAYLALFGTQATEALAIYTHHHDHKHNAHGDVIHGTTA